MAEICRRAGISQATYFNWKKKHEGLTPPEMRRLTLLEDENTKLRMLVADLSLDREMLQDVIRRKPSGLLANASWWMGPVWNGPYRSGELAVCWKSICRVTIMSRVAAIGPVSRLGSGRLRRYVSGTATVACACCRAAKDGLAT